jgi:hypothetical protein
LYHFKVPKTYQSAFVVLKSTLVAICTLKSRIGASPRELDQCGSPYGSTVSLLDGTVHVMELFLRPINIKPPPSVDISQKIWSERRQAHIWKHFLSNFRLRLISNIQVYQCFKLKAIWIYKKLIFCTSHCFLLCKRVILTQSLLLMLPWQHDVTIYMAYINQKSRISGQITTMTHLFYRRKYIAMTFWIFIKSY